MRPLALTLAAVTLSALALTGLGACSSTESGRGSGLSDTFNLGNFKASGDTNGTQTRRDVNRAYTQPTLPTIGNRGM